MLGAAGATGRLLVAELARGHAVQELTLLDRDGDGARGTAVRHGGGRAQAAAVDGTDRQALTLAIEGHQVLVDAAGHATHLAAMDGALAAGCSYVDLGGPEDVIAAQQRLDEAFAQHGLVAVLGCRTTPVAAAVVRLLARGGLHRAGFGVLPLDRAVAPDLLRAELEAGGPGSAAPGTCDPGGPGR